MYQIHYNVVFNNLVVIANEIVISNLINLKIAFCYCSKIKRTNTKNMSLKKCFV